MFHLHRVLTNLAGLATAVLCAVVVPAVDAQAPTPPAPPVRASFGFDIRFRDETLHNLRDFDTEHDGGRASDSHYYRTRVRVWSKATLRWGADLHARFTTEPFKYMDPYEAPDKTEIVLDNIYLDVPRLPLVPARLRAGRLDYPLGDGFLLMDGGPGDGSRTSYQNAIIADLDGQPLGLGPTTLALIAIRNLVRDPLVVANDRERMLIEKDETAFGLHVSTPALGPKAEALYIYKRELRGDANAAPPPDTRLSTLSLRLSGKLPGDVSGAAEGAYQFGSRYDWRTRAKIAGQHGLGLHGWAERAFLAPLMPALKGGILFLSGDDPDTDTYEGWSPLFSRWPMWSELYIYTLIPESLNPEKGRVAYWQNLFSFYAGVGLKLGGSIDLTYTYRRLLAQHALDDAARGLFGHGLVRGDLHIWLLTARVSDRVTMRILAERMAPGSFYAGARDDGYFVRWEIQAQR